MVKFDDGHEPLMPLWIPVGVLELLSDQIDQLLRMIHVNELLVIVPLTDHVSEYLEITANFLIVNR